MIQNANKNLLKIILKNKDKMEPWTQFLKVYISIKFA